MKEWMRQTNWPDAIFIRQEIRLQRLIRERGAYKEKPIEASKWTPAQKAFITSLIAIMVSLLAIQWVLGFDQ